MAKKSKINLKSNYNSLIGDISSLLETARRTSARAVNAILTATYWEIGRRIVEYEYQGMDRIEYYGEKLLENLSIDLQKKFGRGFSRQNIQLMKQFYEVYPIEKICQTLSGKSQENIISQTLSAKSSQQLNIRQTPSGKSLANIVQTLSAQSNPETLSRKFIY